MRKSEILTPNSPDFYLQSQYTERRYKFFPQILRGSEGVRKVISLAKEDPTYGLGLDWEFDPRNNQPSIIGVSYVGPRFASVCASHLHDITLIRDIYDSSLPIVAYAGTDADKRVAENVLGFETDLARWEDPLIRHYLCNPDYCSAPGKEEDEDDSYALGLMNLWTSSSQYTDLPNWKYCRGEIGWQFDNVGTCFGPCPVHDVFGYCAVDAYAGHLVNQAAKEEMRQKHIPEKLYEELKRLTVYCGEMTRKGIKVDRELIKNLEKDFYERKQLLFSHEIRKKKRYFGKWSAPNTDGEIIFLPNEFNPNSPKDAYKYFSSIGIELRGRGGKPSTNKGDVIKALNREIKKKGLEFDSKLLAVVDSEGNDCVESLPHELRLLANLCLYKCSGKGLKSWFDESYIDEDSMIHPRFIVTGASTGRLSSANPNCFDKETEVLTEDGWKFFKDLTYYEKVAQWHKNGSIDFVLPTDYYAFHYSGNMISLLNQHINLRVTEDHRCLLKNRKNDELYVVPAAKYHKDAQQINAGIYVGGSGLPLSNAEIQFLVAAQADGSYSWSNKIDFSFKKLRKIQRFRQILEDIEAEYIESNHDEKIRFGVIGDYNLFGRLYLGENKQFSNWILNLSRPQLDVFVEEVFFWDGLHKTKSNYASCRKQNTDWVGIALTLSDKRVKHRTYVNERGSISHQVDVTQIKNYSLTANIKRNIESVEEEKVYCLSVPSGFIIVRRGEQICITGQCQNFPRVGFGANIRRVLIPSSPNLQWIKADVGGLEYRIIFWYAGERHAPDTIFEDIVNSSEGKLVNAAKVRNFTPRDVAKSLVHAGNYFEGLKVIKDDDLRKERIAREIECGALVVYRDWQYGGGYVACTGANLAERVFGSRSLADRAAALELQDCYFRQYPFIREFQKEISRDIERKGYVKGINGHQMDLYNSPEDNLKLALAFLGQGGGAVYVREAMLRYAQLGEIMNLQVHDELATQKPKEWSDEECVKFMSVMSEESEYFTGLRCPIKVSRGERYKEGSLSDELHEVGKTYV